MKELILGSEGMGIWGTSVIRKLITILYPNIKITNKNNNNCNIIIKSHFKNEEEFELEPAVGKIIIYYKNMDFLLN